MCVAFSLIEFVCCLGVLFVFCVFCFAGCVCLFSWSLVGFFFPVVRWMRNLVEKLTKTVSNFEALQKPAGPYIYTYIYIYRAEIASSFGFDWGCCTPCKGQANQKS